MKNETANQCNYYERQLIHCFQRFYVDIGNIFQESDSKYSKWKPVSPTPPKSLSSSCCNVYTFVIIKNIIIYCIMYGWLNMVYGLSYFFNWTELNQFITLISFFSLLTDTNLIGSDKDKTLREGITHGACCVLDNVSSNSASTHCRIPACACRLTSHLVQHGILTGMKETSPLLEWNSTK